MCVRIRVGVGVRSMHHQRRTWLFDADQTAHETTQVKNLPHGIDDYLMQTKAELIRYPSAINMQKRLFKIHRTRVAHRAGRVGPNANVVGRRIRHAKTKTSTVPTPAKMAEATIQDSPDTGSAPQTTPSQNNPSVGFPSGDESPPYGEECKRHPVLHAGAMNDKPKHQTP